jgi:hypothetical protein
LAKDRKPASGNGRPAGTGGPAAKAGRTRPAANVVAPQRPWGLIAAAMAVVVFAAAVITYAVVQVNKANADKVESIDEIAGVKTYDYSAGQEHVYDSVTYPESPPVGGAHDYTWADCTGTVYDVDIRHENAVHSLEHGAVWITYDPAYVGLDSPISVQAWNNQLKVDDAGDKRIKQFADLMTYAANLEPGASCENPEFAADPAVAGEPAAPAGPTDPATTPTSAAETGSMGGSTGTSAP